jgi:hypothetical protein
LQAPANTTILCYVQAIVVAIDQYAEAALGTPSD